jgi:hypothetical protein
MPTVNSVTLTLTTVNGQDVTAEVDYEVTVTPFEKQLCEMGMDMHIHAALIGVDDGDHRVLEEFDRQVVPAATEPGRTFSGQIPLETTRAALQEDPGLGDDDEIGCNVRVHCVLPPEFTDDFFSVQRILTDN